MARKPKHEHMLTVTAPSYDYWDYFSANPDIPATDLLQRVYEALVIRKIPFYFSYFLGDALFTKALKEHIRVHFFLPNQNIAIIVKGGFWFDKGNNLNETAMDIAMLEYAGINAVFWTEDEIMRRGLDEMFRDIPELNVPYEEGEPIIMDYPPLDYRSMVLPIPHPFRKQREVKYQKQRRRGRGW